MTSSSSPCWPFSPWPSSVSFFPVELASEDFLPEPQAFYLRLSVSSNHFVETPLQTVARSLAAMDEPPSRLPEAKVRHVIIVARSTFILFRLARA